MRLNERCTALVAVLTLLLLLDSSWAQKYPDKPPKKQKPISDPHYRYQKQHDEYYGGYGGYGQQHGGYRQPYSGGYKQPYPSSKQPYKQDPYKQDYYQGSYKQPDYYRDGYDSYDSYGSYGKKKKYKKEKEEPTLSTTVEFKVEKCSLRYPGVGLDTTIEPKDLATSNDTVVNELKQFVSRPSNVDGWWSMGCSPSRNMDEHKHKHKGYGDYDKDYYGEEYSSGSYNDTNSGDSQTDVGECWYWGNADYGIRYKANTRQEDMSMGTSITFICEINPEKARFCDPGLDTVDGRDDIKVLIGGHGRVGITKGITFDIENNKKPRELLITGFFNGRADDDHPNLPLTRYNVGRVTTLTLNGCTDENLPVPDPTGDFANSTATAGDKSKFIVQLTT